MNIDIKDDLNRLNTSFFFMEAVYLFRNEQVTDHCKRVVSRFLFIQIDNILKIAGKTKNKLWNARLIKKTDEQRIKGLIQILENSYNQAYDTIRDKIAAHNQPLSLISLFYWWNDVNLTSIQVLYEDATNIQAAFASATGWSFQRVSGDAQLSIPDTSSISRAMNQAPSFSADRLGLSKLNTVSMIPCHPSQEKLQIILSIIDFLETDFALTAAANNPVTDYQNAIFDTGWLLAMVDICSLIDNLFVDNGYDRSLLAHWEYDMAGYAALSNLNKTRNLVLEKQIRDIRNVFGAHIDPSRRIADIYMQYNAVDLVSVHEYACRLIHLVFDACRQDMRTRMFCISDTPLIGVGAVEENAYLPFQA